MVFLIGFLITGALLFVAYRYLTNFQYRRDFNADWRRSPTDFVLIAVGIVFFVGFFFGVLVPALGLIRLSIGNVSLPLWQASAIGGLVWLAVINFVISRRNG
ncbi:hypothetical protein LRP31_15460 [Mesorhizobium mediterraneum]|uniref:Uncharacterized protein n=1 Tax=Mesorhizobium mediterraneum TaxID=43617 RepID=A0AB36RI23_9HYPH|nr:MULTISPECIES: hypothetical protein [Mesorhizobium]PAQ04205.1 hypothetical protein CIT25_01585 [Mesorhizobium mediterraneum]RWN39402.1 MAG: hypothetical protein EOR96_21005 [Mesorhizobium sp.]RWO95581.1 MAG: hypothetical protein EOQ98_25705 [Mesorhizobium sp.]TIM44709.1 MAG: hypothetical protein E5Y69_10555 [Mesorhizobium sp.]TIT41496.1 MAG: hypothetical protein E5W78_00685 [Mesorhizobium sp.]